LFRLNSKRIMNMRFSFLSLAEFQLLQADEDSARYFLKICHEVGIVLDISCCGSRERG
jgi:hypothetical protein